jgi:hypothetical protein
VGATMNLSVFTRCSLAPKALAHEIKTEGALKRRWGSGASLLLLTQYTVVIHDTCISTTTGCGR